MHWFLSFSMKPLPQFLSLVISKVLFQSLLFLWVPESKCIVGQTEFMLKLHRLQDNLTPLTLWRAACDEATCWVRPAGLKCYTFGPVCEGLQQLQKLHWTASFSSEPPRLFLTRLPVCLVKWSHFAAQNSLYWWKMARLLPADFWKRKNNFWH